jgi:RNA polymerase sigma factor (sigma-70 family)
MPTSAEYMRRHRQRKRERKCRDELVLGVVRVAYQQANRKLGNSADAEDFAQDCILRMLKYAPKYDANRGAPSTWARLVIDTSYTHRGRTIGTRLQPFHFDDFENPETVEPQAREVDADSNMDRQEIVARVREALAFLPANKRRLLMARFKGKSFSEIARLRGVTNDVVRRQFDAIFQEVKARLSRPELRELIEVDTSDLFGSHIETGELCELLDINKQQLSNLLKKLQGETVTTPDGKHHISGSLAVRIQNHVQSKNERAERSRSRTHLAFLFVIV